MTKPDPRPAIGLTLTPSVLHMALIQPDGARSHAYQHMLNDSTSRLSVLRQVADACHLLVNGAGLSLTNLAGVGVAIPATIHLETESVASMTGAMPGWHGTEIGALLREALGCHVLVEERIQLAALAEAHYGVGRGVERLLYIHAGETLHAAIVEQGGIWRTHHAHSDALGLMVADWKGVKPVTLNEVAAVPGIVRMYHSRSRANSRPDFAEIRRMMLDDALARRVMRDGGRILGTLLAPLVGLIDPQQVVVGGDELAQESLWWQSFEMALYRSVALHLDNVALVRAALPALLATQMGAALRVWQSAGAHPADDA